MAATCLFPSLTDAQFTKRRFSQTVVIVTGGASGIGKATVERFANDGATVIIFDINSKLAEQVATSLRSSGHHVEFMTVDVSDRDQCMQAVNTVAENHGQVNFLVNNAAYLGMKGITATVEDWDKTMSVNVQGCCNMVQACHPHMLKAQPGQRAVVNLASIGGHRSQPSHRWTYNASKGAVIALTKCMALDLAKDGIRVNSVSPGFTWTGPLIQYPEITNKNEVERIFGKYHMVNRFGEPSEIAAAITYLCSRDASFITSADFPIDGGYLGMSAEGRGTSE